MTRNVGPLSKNAADGQAPGRPPATFGRRLLSSVILIPIAFLAIIYGGLAFAAMVALAGLAMAFEWQRLVSGRVLPRAILGHALTTLAAVYAVLIEQTTWAVGIIPAGALATGLAAYGAGNLRLWATAGVLYTSIPCAALVWIRGYAESGFELTLILIFVVVATDIGAYLAGKSIGGPKLVPRLSPSKTWAGLVGGMVLAALTATYLAHLTLYSLPVSPAFLGIAIAVVSQTGDIAESAIKRRFRVKDSGNLIPGHGGVLDRLDGLLFATIAATLILLLSNI